MRTAIYYDNIDNISEILANLFNKYTHPYIINWCQHKNIVDNNATNILRPKDRKFVDAVTSQNINITQITLATDTQQMYQMYQQIFSDGHTSLLTFMKFVLGLTYLLTNLKTTHLEDFYPFIGITYFIYSKIERSSLMNDNNKGFILQDIRNLWNHSDIRTSVPLSVYIQNSLIQTLNDVSYI
ncbi:hypothetical protein C1645_818263 [Glomus cerebriforme]|uniref:Uncharacterized protein n=1 Tax=Glomus cerebriforme TaxID=658196 RepID=A0A397T7U0_9GLOM|nr:hypothetical protein C1645_818263 [Glomus cerebriforme]